MSRSRALLFIYLSFVLVDLSYSDVGSSSFYNPPYLPTACYGNDPNQFPIGTSFAAAGEGIWDNDAACGRTYLVRCLSSATPNACIQDKTVRVRIIDRASAAVSRPSESGTTMTLSAEAYRQIASPNAPSINIEFVQSA